MTIGSKTKTESKLPPARTPGAVRRLCNRQGVVEDWPDPPIDFPSAGEWDREFPVLMFPWGGGQPIIYSIDDQMTYFKKVPPKWWLFPKVLTHVSGEEYRQGMGALKFAAAFYINLTHPDSGGVQIDAATWLINDLYEPDLDANQRAYNLVNLPAQPEGVGIVRPVQVSNAANFNSYLVNFQESGFIGALLRPLTHKYGDPQFVAVNPI